MVEAANILGVLAAVLLLMAVIAWVKLLRSPLLQRAVATPKWIRLRASSRLSYFCAAGLSSAAVFLAIAGWIFA